MQAKTHNSRSVLCAGSVIQDMKRHFATFGTSIQIRKWILDPYTRKPLPHWQEFQDSQYHAEISDHSEAMS